MQIKNMVEIIGKIKMENFISRHKWTFLKFLSH